MDSVIGTIDSMLSTASGAVTADGVGPEKADTSAVLAAVALPVLVDWV